MSATATESKLFVNPELAARKQREEDFIDKLYILSELPPSFDWDECVELMKKLMSDRGVYVPDRDEENDTASIFFDRLNAMDCESITGFTRICNNYLDFSKLK